MEDGGGIEVVLRAKIDELEKDLLQAQKKIDKYSKELGKKGEAGGKQFSAGFNKGNSSYDKTLKKMSDELGALPGMAGSMGTKMASTFSKPIFAMAPKVALAFKAMMGPIGLIIGAITAIAGIVMKVVGTFKEQKKATDDAKKATDNLKKSNEELYEAESEKANKLKKWTSDQSKYNEELYNANMAMIDRRKELGYLNEAHYEYLKSVYETEKALEDERIEWQKSRKETKLLKESTQELLKVQNNYGGQLKLISDMEKMGLKSSAEAAKDRLSASESYLDSLVKQRQETIYLAGAESARVKELDNTIAKLKETIELDRIRARNLELGEVHRRMAQDFILFEKICDRAYESAEDAAKAKLSAVEGYIDELNSAIVEIENNLRRLMQPQNGDIAALRAFEEELEKLTKEQEAELSYFTARRLALSEELAGYENKTVETKKEELTLQQQIDNARNAAIKQYNDMAAIALDSLNSDLITQAEYENLIYNAKQAQHSTLQKIIIDYGKLDGVTKDMLETVQDLKDDTADWLKDNKKAVKEFRNVASQAANQLVQLGETIGQMRVDELERTVEKEIKILEDRYEEEQKLAKETFDEKMRLLDEEYKRTRDKLDAELQDKLFQMGLVDAATAEQYEENLRLAIESGNHHRILEADSALQKFLIEEEYAQKQKELDEEMAAAKTELEDQLKAEEEAREAELTKNKAELQYKAELAAWKMNKYSAMAQAALAIAQAAASGWPMPAPVLIPIATAIGAAQVGAVVKAKPILQYAEGGIVPGRSFTGDKILGGLNSGEEILTRDDRKLVRDYFKENEENERSKMIVIPINLDGRPIAKAVIDLVNNRHFLIKQGSIVA